MSGNNWTIEYHSNPPLSPLSLSRMWMSVCEIPVYAYALHPDVPFSVHTPEGIMHGNAGDWLIKYANGELYVCNPDVFDKTYELV